MDIVRVKTTESPAAVGPYSQASVSRGFLFTSGILPLDVSSGGLIPGGIEAETRKVLDNLKAVLEAGGSSMGGVVKITVYMTDMSDFTRMNDVYAEYFGSILPSRATIQVGALAKGAQIEIEAVALV
jgi:2-iminobutanoate/2-iminopropanoate deaminase